jgi:hypothetical protein
MPVTLTPAVGDTAKVFAASAAEGDTPGGEVAK